MTIENMGDEPSPTQEHRTPADILNAAADLLEKPGAWVQETFGRRGECYCVRGAISAAAGHNSLSIGDDPSEEALAKALFGPVRASQHLAGSLIVQWNDAKGRTQSEVVAKLREAAALAREAGQ
jgi:hypothetical protein